MNKNLLIVLFFIVLALPAHALAYQVALDAKASKAEVAKGETFTYTLRIIEEGEANEPVQLVPPDFTGFGVTGSFSSSSLKEIGGRARRVTDQEYRLSCPTPGGRTIGPARLVLTDPKTGVRREMTSNAVNIVVTESGPGVLKGLEEDIRDIKSPKTFMDKVRLIFYGLAALVLLVLLSLIGLALYLVRKKRRAAPRAAPAVQTPLSPRERALEALARAESLRADAKAFYSAVTDAVRAYLRDTHGIPAVEATTTEIMAEASRTTLPQTARDGLWALLGEADLVKFAKHVPTDEEKTRFMEKARALISQL